MANMLRKKLFRDMRQAGMQFLSIVLLCSLGTFIFAGLDGIANLAQGTLDVYFEENNMADFWITVPSADRDALARLGRVEGIEAVAERSGAKLETTLPGKPTVMIAASNGPMMINRPLVDQGEMLSENDVRGCLIQAGFAREQGLAVGDRITVDMNGTEFSFLIRGTSYTPEFICVTEGNYPNPREFGYILINAKAMPELPLSEILVKVRKGADTQAVKEAIQKQLPGALVLDRRAHRSTANALSNAEMFANLTLVFPLFAYAVAALIVMTTLTRMIDNQRLQLGTLKALGYSSRKIRGHYLSYAIWPSLIGSVLGIFVGHLTLPRIIWALLLGQNEYPYRIYPAISSVSWGIAAFTVIMSVLICLHTYRKSAKETTAELLRPKPPKAGKRIILERIGFVWGRLSFNSKMIVRNLMRNRMRTLMSFVGVLCCNSLIIASFGLQDSVNALAQNHYTKTLSYDVRANLIGQADKAESYYRRLEADTVECIMETSASVQSPHAGRTTLVTVVEPDQTLLNLGPDSTHVQIDPQGIAITEKLAQTLQVHPGDQVRVRLPGEEDELQLTISQMVYNNVSQGIYMQSSTWESLRKGAFVPTAILVKNPGFGCIAQLEDMDEVDSLDYPAQQSHDLTNMLELIGSVFVILMLLALALAFVICYNMGLMNFAERIREYATLKVLGYHQREIRQLILGENNLIAVLAVLGSIWPGMLLTNVVLQVCQSDTFSYPTKITGLSIAGACLITLAFSVLIQLFLVRKVRGIDMVEALKSVE